VSSAPPQLIGNRYRLVEPLGQGGMGRVWKARDEVLHRDVAIKELVPPPGLTEDERREMRERSLREARAIARLNHANVVRVFDVLRTDGDPWIVMEYVPSRSLQDVLTTDGPVSPTRAAEIGLGVLGALKAAHRAGVMHRDVKPGNVLLGEDGRVVLTDFGLATVPGDPNVTRTGLVLGSPAYIAPERARDGTFGPEADLWSLGATLYAAVEGQSPRRSRRWRRWPPSRRRWRAGPVRSRRSWPGCCRRTRSFVSTPTPPSGCCAAPRVDVAAPACRCSTAYVGRIRSVRASRVSRVPGSCRCRLPGRARNHRPRPHRTPRPSRPSRRPRHRRPRPTTPRCRPRPKP